MSATIPNEMKLKELLKSTGYDCPEDMQDKTFTEATSGSGGGGGKTEHTRDVTYIANGDYTVKPSSPDTETLSQVNIKVNVPFTDNHFYLFVQPQGYSFISLFLSDKKITSLTVEKYVGPNSSRSWTLAEPSQILRCDYIYAEGNVGVHLNYEDGTFDDLTGIGPTIVGNADVS